ncbi:TIGR02391 family protein [Cupriavidus necator]|uniref:TIGR02391 family protein n=1 Tax=Cupriavidus necator TaxID=106590 RepID=UPI0039C0B20A
MISQQELPADFLHPASPANVRPLFLQSRFDTAVFEAFKSPEVAIRKTAGLGDDSIGVALPSRAFHPENGTLTDLIQEKGESTALLCRVPRHLGESEAAHRRLA